MDITVNEVEDLPANTFLSVRYGEARKQAPFKKGEAFSFAARGNKGNDLPKAFTVDVFRKVGSKQVSLAGISAMGGSICHEDLEIPSLDIEGMPVKASITASLQTKTEEPAAGKATEPSRKQQVAVKARNYIAQQGVQPVLQEMFAQLLEHRPPDPLAFLANFIERKRDEAEAAEGLDDPPDFSEEPGLGEDAMPGFGPEQELPDLSRHNSVAAKVLRGGTAELKAQLAQPCTALGISLANCVKAGIDCLGHPSLTLGGAYAGDAESYELFQEVFDPIIAALHTGWSAPTFGEHFPHPMEGNPAKVTNATADGTGQYVVFVTMEARRNLAGFRLPNCCSKEERREVEKILTSAEGLNGAYLPLRGSGSHGPKQGGMAGHQEERLKKIGMLFSDPDSQVKLAAGFGRHWPDARGVLVGDAPGMFVWCNEEDHLRFIARQQGGTMKALFARLSKAILAVGGAAASSGHAYAVSQRHGYVTTCPSRLGCALRITTTLKIPRLAAAFDVASLCKLLELHCDSSSSASTGLCHVSSGDGLSMSEVDMVNINVRGCKRLVDLEQRLEKGEAVFDAMPGLGFESLPGIMSASGRCPKKLPAAGLCKTLAAACLRDNPDMYTSLRTQETPGGVKLGHCIRSAFDLVGGDALCTGLVVGDADCVDVFSDLFNAVLCQLPRASQLTDAAKSAALAPNDSHCRWVRVELRRNLSVKKFAPCCTKDDRREAERVLVSAMRALVGDGSYAPLAWSQSFPDLPGGVSMEEQRRLSQEGKLFMEPRIAAALEAGIGRDWPDARGAFLVPASTSDMLDQSVAWINQEDHLRLRCSLAGADLKAAFTQARGMADGIEAALEGGFAKHDRFGFLTVDALHLGPAAQLTSALSLPLLSARHDFTELCARLGLVPTWSNRFCELSSYPAPELSGEELLEQSMRSFGLLVQLETMLEKDGEVDALLAEWGLQ